MAFESGFGGARQVGVGIGPVLEKFEDVRRIAVLRGGGLGDLIYTYPALQALKTAYPGAELTLLGTSLHASLAAATEGPVDAVELLPFAEGVHDGDEDPAALDAFFEDMQARRFDLAVQMHGGGRYSNPFLLRLGAQHTVGTRTPDAIGLERTLDYIYYQHEPSRWLEVAGYAGAPPAPPRPLRPCEEHRRNVAGLRDPGRRALLVVHPGASDPRRRWPASSFAEAAATAARQGAQVLVVGDTTEKALAQEVAHLIAQEVPGDAGCVRSLAGELSIGDLAALLDDATAMLASDSGPRHLAQALGTPTIGIFWVGNVINAAPAGRGMHRVHMSWVTRCSRCGIDVTQVGWTAPHCGHNDSMVAEIQPANVAADVDDLMARSLLLRGK